MRFDPEGNDLIKVTAQPGGSGTRISRMKRIARIEQISK
jgi:hypothetical protein